MLLGLPGVPHLPDQARDCLVGHPAAVLILVGCQFGEPFHDLVERRESWQDEHPCMPQQVVDRHRGTVHLLQTAQGTLLPNGAATIEAMLTSEDAGQPNLGRYLLADGLETSARGHSARTRSPAGDRVTA